MPAALARIGPLDARAAAAAASHLDRLTKPPGSLGRLEELLIQLAGITGVAAPRLEQRAIVVFAADHGVAARGVSAYPSEVTAQMVANFLAGGAAINALAGRADAVVIVVDVGVASPISEPATTVRARRTRLVSSPIRRGTRDLSVGPALTREETIAAIDIGFDIADEVRGEGTTIVGLGGMGIGNTTAASAIVAALTGPPVRSVTGRGTGADEDTYERKVRLIERALGRDALEPADPIGILASVGGLEIAALTGFILGASAARLPVILDGFITGAAALVAARLCPDLPPRLIAGHRSPEPGHAVILDELGLRPLLDLGMRLGEGSGAALALLLVDAACRVREEMATFAAAGVAGPVSADGDRHRPPLASAG